MCVRVCVFVFSLTHDSLGGAACAFKFHSCLKVCPTQLQFLGDICTGACASMVKSEANCILASRSLERHWWLEASILPDTCSSSQHQTEDPGFGSAGRRQRQSIDQSPQNSSNTRFTLEPRITPKLAFKTPTMVPKSLWLRLEGDVRYM